MAIKRRTFIKRVGGIAAAASVGPLSVAAGRDFSVGVVGGGIVGASIALHLANAGANVSLFEKTAPAAGATSKSFAWINAFTNDPHYRSLRMKSIAAYRELDEQLDLGITWGGAIHWAMDLAEAERMKADASEFSQAGYDARLIDADELGKLAPNVSLGDFNIAMFNALDGHMDPVEVTGKLLEAAKRSGATVVYPCEVKSLRFQDGRLTGIATTAGDYVLDRVVIAAGIDTPALAEQAGYTPPLVHSPGILAHTAAAKPIVDRVIESPNTYFKQNPNGRIVGNDGYYAPEIAEHAGILQGPQEMPDVIRNLHGQRILDTIKRKLPAASDLSFDYLTLGYRPMPKDRLPIVGHSPGNSDVYVSVMHSGVTLAAIMGRYITHELLSGEMVDDLAPYRPERF